MDIVVNMVGGGRTSVGAEHGVRHQCVADQKIVRDDSREWIIDQMNRALQLTFFTGGRRW
jgi:hypothetical protein